MKAFRTWKGVIRRRKFAQMSKSLREKSCVFGSNRAMRTCFLKLFAHFAKLSTMGVTEVQQRTAKHINDFFGVQKGQVGI